MKQKIKNILELFVHLLPSLFLWFVIKYQVSFVVRFYLMFAVIFFYTYDLYSYFFMDFIRRSKEIDAAKNASKSTYYMKRITSLGIFVLFLYYLLAFQRQYSMSLSQWIWEYGNEGRSSYEELEKNHKEFLEELNKKRLNSH